MSDQGNKKRIFVGSGEADGQDNAKLAVMEAFNGADEAQIREAKEIIIDAQGRITLMTASVIGDYVQNIAGEEKNIVYNVASDETMGDRIKVTVFLMVS